MFDKKDYGDQQVWINGQMVSGVQSIDAGYTLPVQIVPAYGGGFTETFASKVVGNISMEKLIVGHDIFYDLISTGLFSGHLDYDGGVFGFLKAYLTDYSCSCAVNGVASSSANIVVYGNAGSGVATPTDNVITYPIQTVGSNGISLTLNNVHSTNRVQSFDYEVSINRNPVYFLGSSEPNQVLISWPIEVTLTFTLEVDDYASQQLLDIACKERAGNLSISLLDCPGDTVNTLYMPNAKLESESVKGSVGDNLSATMVYKAYLNSLEGF